ncbi:MAG TPA: DinB family protein, partial [Herpetosiphonaceae bacterium]|nr:DinB family protein [Herpetosiphonaceae bacterium]
MPEKPLPVDEILAMLRAGPPRLAAAAAGLDAAQLSARPGQDEWSANETLAHLRSCADMWGAAIETIIAEDAPTIRAVNPTTWIKST